MVRARIADIVRQFPENGMKLLQENPQNVHDLLIAKGVEVVDLIDFDRLTLVRNTFVKRDYRHVESDVVLRGPVKRRQGDRSPQTI